MRLRVTVRRNGVPDFPLVWPVDSAASLTVYQLLEQISEVAPVTDEGEWGLEDYAVEIRGSNGVNYECLHYQVVQSTMKDEDEIIIRPLLYDDLKVRHVSGRHQISSDGKHIYDGVALGRPKLKRIKDRPAVHIQPRKRPRLLEQEQEDEDEPRALEVGTSHEVSADKDKQMVFLGDLDDEDSEDDEDFAPEDDADSEVDESDEADELERNSSIEEVEEDETYFAQPNEHDGKEEIIEDALADVPDFSFRSSIRALHAAFPKSPLEVCRYVLEGTNWDMDKAHSAMWQGFAPAKGTTKLLEDEDITVVKNTQSEVALHTHEHEHGDSMEVEAEMTTDFALNDSLLDHFDNNGLPPGSIKSGKALKFMADALKSSPSRTSPGSRDSTTDRRVKSLKPVLKNQLRDVSRSSPVTDTAPLSSDVSSDDSEDTDSDDEGSKDYDDEESSEESGVKDSEGSSDDSSAEELIELGGGANFDDLPTKEVDTDKDEDSSADDSDSSSDSSSEEEASKDAEIELDQGTSESESDSSSEGDSSSGSDDEAPEQMSSQLHARTKTVSQTRLVTPNAKDTSNFQKPSPKSEPGCGKKSTHSRNRRRRLANILQRYQEKGILPAGTTTSELSQMRLHDNTSPQEALAQLERVRNESSSIKPNDRAEFERIRNELIASLASGGIELGSDTDISASKFQAGSAQSPPAVLGNIDATRFNDEVPDSQPLPDTLSTKPERKTKAVPRKVIQTTLTEDNIARSSTAPDAPVGGTPTSTIKPHPASASSSQLDAADSRRSRLDLGAGKRLLFGALGIKPPKTTADREKIQEDLMKLTRPLKVPKSSEENVTSGAVPDEDPEAWRERINYRAVECVQEGVELSEPPFPFVQRWDPQQQNTWAKNGNRGGKRKQSQRDQEQYYNDPHASKKQKQGQGKHHYAEMQDDQESSYDASLQHDRMPGEDLTQSTNLPQTDINNELSQQLMQEIQAPHLNDAPVPEDLPALPTDPSSLPALQEGEAKFGMTIAFKSLEMSAATNWAPQISAYRTAIVVAIEESGRLQLNLAIRDRYQPEKHYDEATGERIYDKFDIPDDEDMEVEDDGVLYLAYDEMFEPKVVQQAADKLVTDGESHLDETAMDVSREKTVAQADSQNKDGDQSEASKTMSHEKEHTEEPEAQLSHVTETPLPSGVPEHQLDDIMEDISEVPSQQEHQPENVLEEGSEEFSAPHRQPDLSADNLETVSVPNTIGLQNEVLDSVTPSKEASDGNRDIINTLMKGIGYDSADSTFVVQDDMSHDVLSSGKVTDQVNPQVDVTTSADLIGADSPRFNGFGTPSPVPKQRQTSVSSNKLQGPPVSSPPNATQNTWETVDSDYGTSSPGATPGAADSDMEDISSSWITEGQSGYPSSPIAKRSIGPSPTKEVPFRPSESQLEFVRELKSPSPDEQTKTNEGSNVITQQPDDADAAVVTTQREKKKRKKVPVSRAQQLWEQFQPVVRTSPPETAPSVNEAPTPERSPIDSKVTVSYPQISVGSSFTSQVTDVGRQPEPEFNTNEYTSMGGDSAPIVPDASLVAAPVHTHESDVTKENGSLRALSEVNDEITDADDAEVNSHSDPLPSESSDDAMDASESEPEPSEDEASSDDFPAVGELLQRETIKREPSASSSSSSAFAHYSSSRENPKSMAVDEGLIASDHSTPKASRQNRRTGKIRSPKSNASSHFGSQVSSNPAASYSASQRAAAPRVSPPHPSQAQAMVIDLCSSEPEVSKAVALSSDDELPASTFKAPPRVYATSSDDEAESQESARGWAKKRKNTVGGVHARRATASGGAAAGLKTSSEAPLNQNRRRTVAR